MAPKFYDKTFAASFPLGSISAYKRSFIDSH